MPWCFYCTHCGKCGPDAAEPIEVNPPGLCVFCKAQNTADDETCARCGKLLPRAPGVRRAQAVEADKRGGHGDGR